MPAPQPYDRQYNFQNFQATSPASPLPGDQVDTELNSVKIALDQLLASLALIQRSDGALANASVGIDQLDETVSLGVKSPTTWVTSHNYLPLDAVFRGTVLYRCLIAHTSGSFNTDLANGKWEQIADLTPPSAVEAEDVSYDNGTSGLSATDVQAALDEIVSEMGGGNASDITNDSGVTGDTVADALDFLKTYADGLLAANDAAVFKGVLDCSANPNYPAGDAGEFYKVSVAGKIGGASGKVVEVGDSVWCAVDSSSAGNEASVGANWFVVQGNIDGAVIGPSSATDGHFAQFDGATGKLLKGGKAAPSGDVVGTSDSQTLTNKTLVDPIVGTQSARDNSTKAASTAYVDTATREKLSANRTYYVRSDGSDSNDGLANTSGGAFATIQKAWNTIVTIDLNGFTATIKLGNTVTLTAGLNATVAPVGGTVIIEGDTTTPTNTIISTTSSDAIRIACAANVTIRYLKLQTTTGGQCVRVFHPAANVFISDGMNWGACAEAHVRVEKGGMLQLQNPSGYIISGGAAYHYFLQDGAKLLGITLSATLSGTPAFSSAFIDCQWGGVVDFFGFSVASGSATGKRFNVANGGMINTYGGGASYWPGNSAGTGTNLATSPYGMYA